MSTQPKQNDANYLKEVREHYENYPYPPMNPLDEKERILITVTEAFDILNHECFSGRRNFQKDFRALVAGGGTGDAVIALAEQLRDSNTEVTYVDMSEASMKVAQERARVRGLTNIRWIRDSLLNIPHLGLGKFDYINCSGVLHHLADPDLGLQTLSDALKDDGAMGIMVYAQYGRMSTYILQDALRIINEDEPNLQTRVDNAKSVLNAMPSSNWFTSSPPMVIQEINAGDVAIYDLLLHSQDRAYTIPQLYGFVEKAGLNIVHFFSDHQEYGQNLYNALYYLKDEDLKAKVSTWPLREQQALAELLHGKIEKHTFYAAKKVPSLPSCDDLDMIPLLGFNIFSEHEGILSVIRKGQSMVTLQQTQTGGNVEFENTLYLGDMFSLIDGKRTLREIFANVIEVNKGKEYAPTNQSLLEDFKPFYEAMNFADWLFLRHKSTSEVLHHDVFQARIPK